jgi:hypothetical protein
MNTAVVAKGSCERHFFPHGWEMSCAARGRSRQLGPSEFTMDPMLASADLSFRQGGYDQKVHWIGEGVGPSPNAGAGTGGGFTEAGVDVSRQARASAHIFGRSLKPGPFQDAILDMGGGLLAYSEMTIARDGSAVRLAETLRGR